MKFFVLSSFLEIYNSQVFKLELSFLCSREYGNSCSLEIYRPCKDDTKKKKKKKRPAPMRSISTPLPAACEVANESQARTSVSMDISKKALDLPDIPPIFEVRQRF